MVWREALGKFGIALDWLLSGSIILGLGISINLS